MPLRLRLAAGLAGLALTLSVAPASAAAIADWTFDDSGVVPLNSAVNAVRRGPTWNASFAESFTNGRGHYVIKRPTGGLANAYAPLPGPVNRPVWLVFDIVGWSFAGTAFNETVRLGLSENRPDNSPRIVAGIRIGRLEENQNVVVVAADALGEGAQGMEPLPLFTDVHQTPVSLVLAYDPGAATWALHLSEDGGATWRELGRGVTSRERTARNLRLGVVGGFNLRRDIFIIDRIALLDEAPAGLR